MNHRDQNLVLVAWRALVRVTVCRLCGALVVTTGREQHNRWHATEAAS